MDSISTIMNYHLMINRTFVVCILLLFASLAYWYSTQPIILGDGVKAPLIPYQTSPSFAQKHQYDEYQVTEVADFVMTAKVLAREDYRFDRGADLSTTDLVFGWGRMSDEAVLKFIDISQSNRWYYWRASKLIIPKLEIARSSANMHLIAATDMVADIIDDIKVGQIIALKGHLVNVSSNDDFSWNSSLSRFDTGDGACELIWVEEISIEPY